MYVCCKRQSFLNYSDIFYNFKITFKNVLVKTIKLYLPIVREEGDFPNSMWIFTIWKWVKRGKMFCFDANPCLETYKTALTEDNAAYKSVQRPFSNNPLFKKLASQRSIDVLVWQTAILVHTFIDVHTFKFHHYFLLPGRLKLGALRNGCTIKYNKLPSRWGHKCFCPHWTLYIVWNGKAK